MDTPGEPTIDYDPRVEPSFGQGGGVSAAPPGEQATVALDRKGAGTIDDGGGDRPLPSYQAPASEGDSDDDGGRTQAHIPNLSQGAVPTAVPVQTVEFIPEIHGHTRTYEPGQLDLKSADLELMTARRPEGLPRLVAGYEVFGVLGRGGMGVVYKARQPGLKRTVALKMILAAGHASDDDIARFRSEAEAVALLKHPNIVQIYEIGDDEGRPYFSLEYVDGGSLNKKLAHRALPYREAAEITRVLADAMASAHAHGIIHRDLKPGNVLLTQEGTPKITDFGLAKRLDDDTGQTQSGSILGTPDYMAPEQAAGRLREVGPRSDIYALGAMLYELLTGRVPLRGESVIDTLRQVVVKEPVAPTQLQPKVPRDLETICLKCLRKDAAKRYASMADLAEDLRRFLAGEPILARPVSSAERLWRWCRRNPRVAALSGGVAALVVAWAVTASDMAWRINSARMDAVENARRAARNETLAVKQATIAEKNADDARRQTEAAKQQHADTVGILLDLGNQFEERLHARRALFEAPELRKLQDDLLDMVRKNIMVLAHEIESSDTSDFAMAATCNRLGELLLRLGHAEDALRQFRFAYRLVKQVADAKPDDDMARGNLGLMLMQIGKMYLELNDDARSAAKNFKESRDLQQEIFEHPRGHVYSAAASHRILTFPELHWGIAELHLGHPAGAKLHFEAARAHCEEWLRAEPENGEAKSYLTQVYLLLGTACWRLNENEASQVHFRTSLNGANEVVAAFPDKYHLRFDLADIWIEYCDAKLRMGLEEHARVACQSAVEQLDQAFAHEPNNIARQPLLTLTRERQALLAARAGEADKARDYYEQARKVRAELSEIEPSNLTWRAALALTLAHCGQTTEAAVQAAEVVKQAPESVGLLLQAARCYSICSISADADQRPRFQELALETLRAATKDDFRDPILLKTDPDLAPLAGLPQFAELLAQIKPDLTPAP